MLASRFISCAMKSSFRPIPSDSSSVSRIWEIWLFKRTTSSSVQILSANKITSAAIRLSSICTSPSSSRTFSSSFARYCAAISGECASIPAIRTSIPESFARISFFKCSPSVALAATNCSNAPSRTVLRPFHSSSSSTVCSSIVSTSGHRANVARLRWSSRPNSSAICRRYFTYSPASAALYFRLPCASDTSSYRMKMSIFPRLA